MKKNNRKGFTLAELLIVVAIIGVLVAISIPIFTAQLEKSREAVDEANIRSAYAEAMAALLSETSDTTNHVTYTPGTGTNPATAVKTGIVIKQQKEGWEGGTAPTIANCTLTGVTPGATVSVTVNSNGACTVGVGN